MLTQDLIIGAGIGSAITIAGMAIALFLGNKPKYRVLNETAYCFECEIEMPVKQNLQTGQKCCSNCGLIHIEKHD